MKRPAHKAFVGVVISAVSLTVHGFGQTATNFTSGFFNTNSGYEAGYEIDGQPNYPSGGWASTDPYNVGPPATGARSVLQFFNFYTLGVPQNGNKSLLFGGYANGVRKPGITNPSIYYNFTPTAAAASDVVRFSIDFALYKPSPEFSTNRDTFGFTLWNSFNANKLLEFQFDPRASWVTNNSSYGFSWLRDGVSQTNNPALTSPTWEFAASTLFRLDVAISGNSFDAAANTLVIQTNGIGAVTNYLSGPVFQLVDDGELGAGLGVTNFGAFSLDWLLESGVASNPGERYMVVNQVSVTTVPEPTSLMLLASTLLFVLLGALARRRFPRGPEQIADVMKTYPTCKKKPCDSSDTAYKDLR